MQIRKATKKDLKILTDFWHEEEKLHKKFDKKAKLRKDAKKRIYNFLKLNLKKSNYVAFIAQDKNKVVGAIQGQVLDRYFTYDSGKVGHFGTAFVIKEHRKKGILKELFKHMALWFKSKKIKFVDLYIHPENRIALKAWKKLGFKETMKLMRKEI